MSGFELLLNIAGGVALLLWATRMIRTGIMRAFGANLRRYLARSTDNRLSALAVGFSVSALIQSSAATALLVVSFAGSGLIAVGPGLAVMLGADIGSTLVVQVLSFDVSWLAPVFLLTGVVVFMCGSGTLWPHMGRLSIGIGLMLLALTLIVAASDPLRDSESLQYVVRPLADDLLLAMLLAAVLTWVIHSSVAMVLLVMTLASTAVIPLELAIALVLGANIGSGLVPFVITLHGPASTRRIPFGNLLFRLIAALAVAPFIGWILPHLAALGASPERMVANFHSLFNIALAAVFLPMTGVVARLTETIFPDRKAEDSPAEPKYLDPEVLGTPTVALACATREVLRMADLVEHMLSRVIDVFRSNDRELLKKLQKQDDHVDKLYESIKLYLTQVSRSELEDADSRRCIDLINFTTNLEHIGDIIDKNLLEIAQKKIEKQLNFSDDGWEDITEMHQFAVDQMQLALSVFVSNDRALARRMLAAKDHMRDLERQSSERHLDRLRSGRVESIETSALHIDILRDLKRINSHLTSVAYPILDAGGELRRSRLRHREEDDSETEADQVDQQFAMPRRL